MKLRGRLVAGGALGLLLLAIVRGPSGNAEPTPEPEEITYESYWVPLNRGDTSLLDQARETEDPLRLPGVQHAEGAAGPTNEQRENSISEEYGKRGVTYYVDSSDLGPDNPSR